MSRPSLPRSLPLWPPTRCLRISPTWPRCFRRWADVFWEHFGTFLRSNHFQTFYTQFQIISKQFFSTFHTTRCDQASTFFLRLAFYWFFSADFVLCCSFFRSFRSLWGSPSGIRLKFSSLHNVNPILTARPNQRYRNRDWTQLGQQFYRFVRDILIGDYGTQSAAIFARVKTFVLAGVWWFDVSLWRRARKHDIHTHVPHEEVVDRMSDAVGVCKFLDFGLQTGFVKGFVIIRISTLQMSALLDWSPAVVRFETL